MAHFNGLGMHLGNLSRLSAARTRSISPENFDGAKGRGGMATEGTGAEAARDLGLGWKISPSIRIAAGETRELADINGSGAIQHIWLTPTGNWRYSILRINWDGADQPAVECPLGDFFACGWGRYAQISSLPVCVNPGSAFNSYWEMPFRKGARITLTNIADEPMTLYYQITYTETDVPDDAAYFHAQFRRVNPLPYKEVYTLLDGVRGRGHYVGTYMAWGVNNSGWWGEGEIKFFPVSVHPHSWSSAAAMIAAVSRRNISLLSLRVRVYARNTVQGSRITCLSWAIYAPKLLHPEIWTPPHIVPSNWLIQFVTVVTLSSGNGVRSRR